MIFLKNSDGILGWLCQQQSFSISHLKDRVTRQQMKISAHYLQQN